MGFSRGFKVMIMIMFVALVCLSDMPYIFADEIAQRIGINVQQRLRKYRIISLDSAQRAPDINDMSDDSIV
jgi:hypothetical protein